MNTVNAWAAGIVDGEGYIRVEKYKQQRGRVRVDNTDIRILEKLKEYYGGKIYQNIRKNRPNSKPCWFWVITGIKTIDFIKCIYPYLISKKEQADVIISFYDR